MPYFLSFRPKKPATIDTFLFTMYNIINKLGVCMKRFLMFLVIAIAVVSLGLTVYYLSADNEVIYIKSSFLVVNKYDNIYVADGNNDLLDFKNRSEYTTLSYSSENDDVLQYNANEGFFTAKVGGESKIIVKTSNSNYARLVVDVLVCDGTPEYPYMINSEAALKKIGTTDEFTTDMCYKLSNNIELTEKWVPIANYSGVFDGNFYTISNVNIDDSCLTTNTDVGFFSTLQKTACVKNLFLTNVNISVSANNVGAIAGSNSGLIQTSQVALATIKNSLESGTSYIGGIVGRNLYDNAVEKIDRCGFDGIITLEKTNKIAGGIAGLNQYGVISESYSRAVVNNNDNNFGGIVGENNGTAKKLANIYDCYYYMPALGENIVPTKVYGIAYQNKEDSQTRNIVTGNYHGGIYLEEAIAGLTADSFESSSNGYLNSKLVNLEPVQFTNKNSFITTKSLDQSKENRYWNFDSVWEIPNKSDYPVLNVYSSVASTYIIDVSNITTDKTITTAQEFYDVLASNTTETYKLARDISFDDFYWGDSTHPIPETFNGSIINPNSYVLSNIKIHNNQENGNVGLVKELSASSVISGLIINKVTIDGEKASRVGVLAAISHGANVYNLTIENVTVNIQGQAYGTVFGFAKSYSGHGINDVNISGVKGENSYFDYAGGVVGINLTDITIEGSVYNNVYAVNLVAHYFGGVAGLNGGKIEKTTAYNITFDKEQNEDSFATIYSGKSNIFVGGICASNEAKVNSVVNKGSVSDVYVSLKINTKTGVSYIIYAGGVAAYNGSNISRAYVTNTKIEVVGSQSVVAGGVVGYNSGLITKSVVDKTCSIDTSITSSVGATKDNDRYILNTNNCSIVGGLVGFDADTTSSSQTIYQCASLMQKIKGYYAGGITGISRGNISQTYCGNSTLVNGGVSITGYMTGGFSAVTAGGYFKTCYAFCALNSVNYGGSYKDVTSALKMDVSCMGGFSVFVFGTASVENSYCVVSFNGNGVSYASCAQGYNGGTINNCAYETVGSVSTSYGTHVLKENMKGEDGYYALKNAIGSLQYWETTNGYPTLSGLNIRDKNTVLPNF